MFICQVLFSALLAFMQSSLIIKLSSELNGLMRHAFNTAFHAILFVPDTLRDSKVL